MACVVMAECLRKEAEVEFAVHNVEVSAIDKRNQGMPYIAPLVRRMQTIVRQEHAYSYYPYLYVSSPLIILSAGLIFGKPRKRV
ncbi:MAG: hypothetical protein JWP89_3153 [Schlesneria sp.]|nr:hypothetical protein [Schlesneria sp.]